MTNNRPVFRGKRIVELAGKFRSVSISDCVVNVLLEYSAATFRTVLLNAKGYYYEGYNVDENTSDLLKRINEGKVEGFSNYQTKISAAVYEAISDPATGTGPVGIDVTDYTAATENFSHTFGTLVADVIEGLASEDSYEPIRFSMLLWSECIRYVCSDFRLQYKLYTEGGRLQDTITVEPFDSTVIEK